MLITDNNIKRALNREYAPKPDVKAEWERMSCRLGIRQVSHHRRNMVLSFLAGIAATIAVIVVFNLFTGTTPANQESPYFFTAKEQSSEVLLTTPDGKSQVAPTDGRLTMASASASTTATPKMCCITTPRGKDYELTLPDGSRVWINADSRLEFPERFVGSSRTVRLEGEAYFEVSKDPKHPFIVNTDYFTTRVLGTTFNLNAYSLKTASIVLVEGSVSVSAGKNEVQLNPGQQFAMANGRPAIQDVDPYPFVQWREGFFYFDNSTLYEIMQSLGRWYNVNIAFDSPAKMELRLHFVADRKSSLREAIRNLNTLGAVEISYENDVVTVK